MIKKDFFMLKKAAMFGLDARIALVIFGSLSLISGAALFSAIGKSKATAIIAEMNEVGKAWDQFYLDTGADLALRGSDLAQWQAYSYNTRGLVEDLGVSNWNGPYITYPAGTAWLDHPIYGNIHIEKITTADWSATSWSNAKCDTAGDMCYAWVSFSGINNASLINQMDEIVDGGDGAGAGDLRWMSSNLNDRVSLKYASIKNPND
jgi:hypothetical protein